MKRLTKKLQIFALEALACIALSGVSLPVSGQSPSAYGGRVTDASGEPVPGVAVTIEGTTVGTLTDVDGNYSISASEGAKLIFDCLGFVREERLCEGAVTINVVLREDTTALDEVVVVGFGQQKKATLTGAISSIRPDDISTTKSSSLAVSMAGKVAGLQIKQQNGMPGTYSTDVNVRGLGSPLYVIDGVIRDGVREFQMLSPEDIESISILKDASAAIFGMNSGNGVIIVKTRRGSASKLKITYDGMVGINQPSTSLKAMNVYQYEELVNEASINVGNGPAYSKDELARRQAVPNVDWYDAVFKRNALQHSHFLTLSGGTDRISTYIGAGYSFEDGMLRSGDINYNKYTLRSNTRASITDNFTVNVNLSAWTDRRTQPGTDGNAFMYLMKHVYNIRPYETVYANGNTDYYNKPTPSNENPVAASYSDNFGHTDWKNINFQSTVDLQWDIPWVKGLSLKGLIAYDRSQATTDMLQKSIKLYNYSDSDGYTASTLWQPFVSEGKTDSDRLDLQAQILYQREFSGGHNLSATAAFEAKRETWNYLYGKRIYDFYTTSDIDMAPSTGQSTGGNSGERRYLSWVGKINYDFRSRYLIELACRYDGSYRYNPEHRWDFFPVVSGGWRISEENFVKDNVDWIDNLKIRASYGKTGQDGGDAFQYMSGYVQSGGYVLSDGVYTNGWTSTGLVNANLSWYTSRTVDVGVDFSVFNGLAAVEFDLYRRNRSGLIGTRLQALPNTFGASLPQENLNRDRTDGVELTLSHRHSIGDFSWKVSANANLARTMTTYEETAPYQSSWDRYRNGSVGRWQGINWLYNVIGRYESEEQIASSPINSTQAGNSFLLPGDYIYEDWNEDGIIDDKDRQPLRWEGSPKLHYGLNLNFWWKGLDVTVLFQGSALSSVKYGEVLGQVLTFNGNSPSFYYDRWHRADPYDENSEWISGYWPSTRQGTTNTYSQTDANTFTRRSSSYLRLKTLEIGYTLSAKWLQKAKIQSVRFYANGFNLLVFCDDYLKYFDPEISDNDGYGYQYPLTRSYNFGLNITF